MADPLIFLAFHKIKFYIFISLLFFIYTQKSFAQDNCENHNPKFSELFSNILSIKPDKLNEFKIKINEDIKQLELDETNSLNSDYFTCMTYLYTIVEDYEKAHKNAEIYLTLINPEPMDYVVISILSDSLGNYKQAEQEINQAISIDSSIPYLFYHRAQYNFKLEKYDQSVRDINKEIKNRNGYELINYDLYKLKADALFELEMLDDSIENYYKSLDILGKLYPCTKNNSCNLSVVMDVYKKMIKIFCYKNNIEKASTIYQKISGYDSFPTRPSCLK